MSFHVRHATEALQENSPHEALVWATLAVAEQQEVANCLAMAALMPADGNARATWIQRAREIME